MTPAEIGFALHYYTTEGDHEGACRNPGAWDRTISQFIRDGLLVEHQDGVARYHGTERLKVFCEALTNVQLPVQRWVMPDPVDFRLEITGQAGGKS